MVFIGSVFSLYSGAKDFVPLLKPLTMHVDAIIEMCFKLCMCYLAYRAFAAIEALQKTNQVLHLQGRIRLHNGNAQFLDASPKELNNILQHELEEEKEVVKKQLLHNPQYKHFTKKEVDALLKELYL